MAGSLQRYLESVWYGAPRGTWLRPLGFAYCMAMQLRGACYRRGLLKRRALSVPVWVVGNLTVGGTGKTPLVAWLARMARDEGYQPGILSRGYGGSAGKHGIAVCRDTDPAFAGDEAVLLAQRTGVPVQVDTDRVRGGEALVAGGCDLVICDDGLQHLRLARDVEIVVADAERGFGNGRCVPAGPLREPLSRLATVDWLIWKGRYLHGYCVEIEPDTLEPLLATGQGARPGPGATVHAVAGIGHPAQFFALLRKLGFTIIEHAFPDHHVFQPEDFAFDGQYPVIMTAKDAVKCKTFARRDWWVLPVKAVPEDALREAFVAALRQGRATG